MMTSQNAGSMLGSIAPTLSDSTADAASTASSTSTATGSASTASAFPTLTLGNVTSLNGAALPLLSFTRGGWTNPAGLPRSELQRVSYSFEHGALVRSYTAELDATLGDVPLKRTLIEHVKSFSMRFMDAGHQWQSQWPVPVLGTGQEGLMLRVRPVAVEVTIELDDWGILMRHIEVAG
jgi:type II secretion system protein J